MFTHYPNVIDGSDSGNDSDSTSTHKDGKRFPGRHREDEVGANRLVLLQPRALALCAHRRSTEKVQPSRRIGPLDC